MNIIDIARKYIGIKEVGNNAGFQIISPVQRDFEKNIRAAGWKPGQAWCCYFMKMIVGETYDKKHYALMNGGVLPTWEKIKASSDWKTSAEPSEGAIVFWSTGSGHGHCGLVVTTPPGQLITIEGNTNRYGSREGDSVMIKQRHYPTEGKWGLLGFATPRIDENDQTSIQPS